MKGMNLDQMTLLARCNGLHTQTFRPTDLNQAENLLKAKRIEYVDGILKHSHDQNQKCIHHHHQVDIVEQFVKPFVSVLDKDLFKTIIQATCRVESTYSIINFGREQIKQTGTGHFSCVGGYHPESQRVLLLDTARFKYPPFWVDIESLYSSVNTNDCENHDKRRGLIVVSKHQSYDEFLSFDTTKEKTIGIALNDHLTGGTQLINTLLPVSNKQMAQILLEFNSDAVKPYLFKFIHDLFMVFTNEKNSDV